MTKKALLAAVNAASQVRVTQTGGLTLDEWPERVALLTSQGFAFDGPNILRKGNTFVMKPKFTRVRLGKFKSTASRYTFNWDGMESHGSVVDLKEVYGALELMMDNRAHLRYEVAS